MELNQFTQAELDVLDQWTAQMAQLHDRAAGETPFAQPRMGSLMQKILGFLRANGVVSRNVVNTSGGSISAAKLVTLSGYDEVTGLPGFVTASPSTAAAVGVLEAAVANQATTFLRSQFLLTNSGLDTNLAAVGDPVYMAAAGALSLSAPTSGIVQKVGFVHTLAASGTLRIEIQAPTYGTVATLASDTDGTLAANSDLRVATQKATKTYADTKLPASYLDTDDTLAANSDAKVASQKAIKTYVDGKAVIGALKYTQVVVPNGSTSYDVAKPADFVAGKPCWATIESGNPGALSNPVAISSAAVPTAGPSAGNLVVNLTGDPGANGSKINVWQDVR